MQEKLTGPATRALVAAVSLTAALPALGISLGDIEIRSALGEPLDARVPLSLGNGETVDATCFSLARDPEPGVPVIAEGLLTVERAGERTELRIRSSGYVSEPAVRVRVRAACPGSAGEALRQYSVLLDPRRGDPVIASLPVVAANLDARSGDTLQGVASKVFPRDAATRDRYVQAMREVNPALASLGDNDPIPAGAAIALPDLRTFNRGAPARGPVMARASASTSAAPDARSESAAAKAPRKTPKPTAKKTRKAPAATSSPQVASASASAPSGDFVLRLSGGNMDLARTREVDDRTRAQLRERLMILESDDQVAAVLALRNRLTQLEQRVNELQLKLAQMPASFPERAAAQPAPPTAPASVAPPAVATAASPAPASQPPAAAEPPATNAAETAKPTEPATDNAKADAATATASADSTATSTSTSTSKAESGGASSKPVMAGTKPGAFDLRALGQSYGLWAAFIGVLALLMVLVWRLTHRPEPEYEAEAWDQPVPTEPGIGNTIEGQAEPEYDATQALDAPDASALRRRYIEERFPDVMNGSLTLDDAASVVKNARLLYEDGATPRAIELLHFAIEEHPQEVRTWLALFEIHRLERQTAEFADLARRFYELHGDGEYWRKVRYFGREIDPGNFLYREDVDALETIAPGSKARTPERFDAARENWLGAPQDFENDVLANELRRALMAGAGIVEQDLVPNPMPALRDAEMFTVA